MKLRSRARPGPGRSAAEKRRARDRSLLRDGIIVLLVVLGLSVTWAVREVPNERLPPARKLTEQLDATYRAIRSGDVVVDGRSEAVAAGIQGGRFERRTAGDRWVLVGEAGGDCYVLWWDESGVRRVRILSSALPCEPSTEAMSSRPDTFDRTGRAVDESEPSAAWEDVLPDPIRLRLWFLPALMLGGALGLAALVRMSIALITGDTPAATRR